MGGIKKQVGARFSHSHTGHYCELKGEGVWAVGPWMSYINRTDVLGHKTIEKQTNKQANKRNGLCGKIITWSVFFCSALGGGNPVVLFLDKLTMRVVHNELLVLINQRELKLTSIANKNSTRTMRINIKIFLWAKWGHQSISVPKLWSSRLKKRLSENVRHIFL